MRRLITKPGREFRPSHWVCLADHPDAHGLWSFDYDEYHISWSADYDLASEAWHIIMSYSHPQDKPISREELEGFLGESGMDLRLPVEAYNQYSRLAGKMIHYFTQNLPAKAVIPMKALDTANETIEQYRNQIEALRTLDIGIIRDRLNIPDGKIEDESILVMARKKLASCPFIDGNTRIESVKWLHRSGYRVSTSLL